MIRLALIPNFKFQPLYNEMGEYLVILPQKHIVVMSMDCTSLHWAFQDATVELANDFDKLFGKDNYTFMLLSNPTAAALASLNDDNEQIDLAAYWQIRNSMRVPFWNEGRDKYRYHTANTEFVV